ncbi:putative alpha-1,2-mannosidase [Streptomyces sp. SLBN-118]|uniref:GH92 family glycosyl hydrolase n=1 Tax=Streptomyces sp. SLBN-118 TaxID=2768454 RepID=UPI00114FDF05|nr:GH92 family glycosyl hydrolase [Streptomyces sp. SLBN-118]TQK50767.1 putative alpha-1,2-mannosidase [Streptomyces sp. SLBN-118]
MFHRLAHRPQAKGLRSLGRSFLAAVTGTALVALALAGTGTPAASAADAPPYDLTTVVNPLIGTKTEGNTFPGATLPFGMVQVSPDTGSGVGYNYDHTKIRGFSQTHLSGVGCNAGTQIPFMPTTGAVTSVDPSLYGQAFDHGKEKATPGYYSVDMPNSVKAELTATMRTGWQRYTFPAGAAANVLVNTGEVKGNRNGASDSKLSVVGSDTVEGYVSTKDFCGSSPAYTAYFSAKFSRSFTSFGTWSGSTLNAGTRETSGAGARGGWVSFGTGTGDVTVKLGLSYTGIDGARRNLATETDASGFDFTKIQQAAHDTWNNKLHKIDIYGGTTDRQTSFYTALYHSLLHPNVQSDVDGRYMGFDKTPHTAVGYTPYQTFSLWDTYRAQNQLVALLEPTVARDYGLSLLAVDKELGWLPRWSLYNTETNTMTGDPVTPFLVDLWSRGLLSGHEEEAYQALLKNATGTPPSGIGLNGRNGNSSYKSRGYVASGMTCTPNNEYDKDCEHPASATLEYAVADASLAIMARALGHSDDANTLAARGQNYRSLFDNSLGFFRPRNSDGAWVSPYNPTDGAHQFHEAGAYQYQWLVPQDPTGLIGLLGGKAGANSRLDEFFAYNDLLANPSQAARTKWVNGAYDYYSFKTYNPNNEPDLLAPYMYLYTGQPYKTATVTRAAFTLFTNAPDGVTGNDDLGTMSAWYVFSSLGIYPLMNGANFYGISTPQFDQTRVTIGSYGATQGGNLWISAPNVSDTNRYITGAVLGGNSFTKTWVSHADIAHGGNLGYTLSGAPGTWGTGAGDAPPSVNSATKPSVNLALNKPATGSAPCSATETVDKAFNGSVSGGNSDKFCSKASQSWLQVDLGSVQSVRSFTVRHAGVGGEPASYNTRAFTIETSPDGVTWTTAVTVSDNTADVTTHPIAARTARYVRLNAAPTQSSDPATRIYELEVYGS